MRAVLLAVVALLLMPMTPARSADAGVSVELSAADLRQINGIFERWENAWNTHNGRAWAELFHDDATWILWTGAVWKGRDVIEKGIGDAYGTVYRESKQSSEPQEIRAVAPDVVIARSLTTLTGDAREPGATIYGRKLLVLTKRDGVWRVLYGQNTRLSANEVKALKSK
jgi:uncharacterized protein (TIGR02246 family)